MPMKIPQVPVDSPNLINFFCNFYRFHNFYLGLLSLHAYRAPRTSKWPVGAGLKPAPTELEKEGKGG